MPSACRIADGAHLFLSELKKRKIKGRLSLFEQIKNR
jgi:hypothetical protein